MCWEEGGRGDKIQKQNSSGVLNVLGTPGAAVCAPTAVAEAQKDPYSVPGFSPLPIQADTRDLPLPTHIF